jgi:hypothetical protein
MNDSWYSYKMAIPRTLECPCNETCQRIMNQPDENLKRIYFGRDARSLLPPTFLYRIQPDGTTKTHCTSTTPRPVRQLTYAPDRAAVLLQETSSSFTLESRSIFFFGNIHVEEVTCPCDDNDPVCRTTKRHVKELLRANSRRSNCPLGTGTPIEKSNASDEEWSRYGGGPILAPYISGDKLVFTSQPVYSSILAPNHIRRIIGGLCPNAAPEYLQCLNYAYKTTKDNDSCGTPEECFEADYFLGR